jgi:hypothetical protein
MPTEAMTLMRFYWICRFRARRIGKSFGYLFVAMAMAGCQVIQLFSDAADKLYGPVSATDTKPSTLYCGSCAKNPSSSPVGGCEWATNNQCQSKSTDPQGNRIAATEGTEIRGWVTRLKGGIGITDGGAEYAFDVLLDFGWVPSSGAAASVTPLNNIGAINQAITPHNVIHFGVDKYRSASARIDPNSIAQWGGPGAPVIHVEVNAWAKGRFATPSGNPPAKPKDWEKKVAGSDQSANDPHFWAFDPTSPVGLTSGPLQVGDYVRLVGTLWEDVNHISTDTNEDSKTDGRGGPDGEWAKRCWDAGSTARRGWSELHPVDFMARTPETSHPTEKLEMIALCGDTDFETDLFPPGPRPSSTSIAAAEELIDGAFTVYRSIDVDQLTIDPATPNRAHLHVKIHSAIDHGAKFKAAYRVFWREQAAQPASTPSQRDRCSASCYVKQGKCMARANTLGDRNDCTRDKNECVQECL